ncbi:aminoglycoside phosphotransferase (APT) family kinase protein [Methylobacterium brachiatum]|uniref:Aminoglycoside phosphotransferase (APT) family kinase protein n=1 Tax=Methylobacterium brachiatum TaxID=269660 RepID=A0AAJ1TXT5_9HYPH|nr:phosphotransferase family protein [Methylobacterium brachiatum]MCB4806426.1 phosphotransferase family protein [Methylobacterium brachiatum]MDQ0546679.1 aminoglycoside phosphotransferase (APT) family kinase protein [Methylobacterium brachiatum]
MIGDDRKAALQAWLAKRLERPDLILDCVQPLGGGSIQENWRLTCRLGEEVRSFVLRKDAAATIASSRSRAEEFAILQVAYDAGICTPEPIGFCHETGVLGAPFAVMALVQGVGLGPRVAKDLSLGGDRDRLAERLGRELARIHAIRPPQDALSFLGQPDPEPALAVIHSLRDKLDVLGALRPSLEWGLRWAQLNAPDVELSSLIHGDFRTGNYMVDADGLVAILDWEFATWGDPMSDLGWFCAECWRFGQTEKEAGGIASRAAFYGGYEAQGGRRVDDTAVRYWEIVAHLRWAVIALEQGHRHISGAERSLELALTGRLVPELELSTLRATTPDGWRRR